MHHVFSEYTKENSPQSARVAHTGVPAAATYTKPAVPHVGVDVAPPATASPQQPLQRHLQTHTSSHSPSRPMRPDVTGVPPVPAMTRAPVRSLHPADTLQAWEKDIVQLPEVQRKATLAQMYFLNHYFDSLRYLSDRRARLAQFEQSMKKRGCSPTPSVSCTAAVSYTHLTLPTKA